MRALLLVLACLALFITPATSEDIAVRVRINGVERKFDPPALMRDGKTYVPLREGAESLGASVKWDEKSQKATITLGTRRTRIAQEEGITVNGRLLIPLRRMSEALNCEVKWDGPAKAVRISRKGCLPSG